jgi:hypothetical protein
VTALVSGRAGVRNLARRSFKWRVPLRWYAVSLLAPPLILLLCSDRSLWSDTARSTRAELVADLYPVPACAGDHDPAQQPRRGNRLDRIHLRTSSRSPRPAARGASHDVFFWLYHLPSFYVETRSWLAAAAVLGIFLLPHLGSRLIVGWLYNSAGARVLIAGLFHAMHNAIVSSTGLVAVLALPQFEVLVIMAAIVVLAGTIIAVATRGRLGLKQSSESDADRTSEGCGGQ